jgi:hypothetical protein
VAYGFVRKEGEFVLFSRQSCGHGRGGTKNSALPSPHADDQLFASHLDGIPFERVAKEQNQGRFLRRKVQPRRGARRVPRALPCITTVGYTHRDEPFGREYKKTLLNVMNAEATYKGKRFDVAGALERFSLDAVSSMTAKIIDIGELQFGNEGLCDTGVI